MERRTLLKCFLVVAGGAVIFPSCRQKESKSSFLLKNITVTAEQEAMLAEFAETLIPASASPGAKDTYAHQYALRILDDCMGKSEQQAFTKGLDAVEDMMRTRHNISFIKATATQRADILSILEDKKGSADAQAFYKQMKNLTIQGYLTSKPVMGQIFNYELVPGRYLAAVPAKTTYHQP